MTPQYLVLLRTDRTLSELLCAVHDLSAALRAIDVVTLLAPTLTAALYVSDGTSGRGAVLRVDQGRWRVVVPPSTMRPNEHREPSAPWGSQPARQPREFAFSGGR